jgi:hypothetical protein
MGVNGRDDNGYTALPQPKFLHFIGNYSRGANENKDGDMNFLFDAEGHVSVIYGSFDDDHNSAYIWNAKLLPNGCSDLPSSKLARCDGNGKSIQHLVWLSAVEGMSANDIAEMIAAACKATRNLGGDKSDPSYTAVCDQTKSAQP